MNEFIKDLLRSTRIFSHGKLTENSSLDAKEYLLFSDLLLKYLLD